MQVLAEHTAELVFVAGAAHDGEALGLEQVMQGSGRVDLGQNDTRARPFARQDQARLITVRVRIDHGGLPRSLRGLLASILTVDSLHGKGFATHFA